MRNGLHANQLMLKAALLLTCFMLVMFYNKAKAAAPAGNATTVHCQQ